MFFEIEVTSCLKIKNYIACGSAGATCGRPSIHSKLKTGEHSSPLRYVVVCTVSFATAFGCLSLAMQLLLFRKNHARLACSVVNALSTAHCRYQLLRFADSRKGCPYGLREFQYYFPFAKTKDALKECVEICYVIL